jgi:hypothetical protein
MYTCMLQGRRRYLAGIDWLCTCTISDLIVCVGVTNHLDNLRS